MFSEGYGLILIGDGEVYNCYSILVYGQTKGKLQNETLVWRSKVTKPVRDHPEYK